MSFECEAAFKGKIALADKADALVPERVGWVILQRRMDAEVLLSEGHGTVR